MNAGHTVDPKQVLYLSLPETGKASELSGLAEFANGLTYEVKTQWTELGPEVQDALRRFAYREPQTRPKNLADRLRRFRTSLALGRVMRKQPEVIREYLNAANDLAEAVLDAVERESPEHQEAVAQAIEEALSDTNSRTMNAEEARERNREIFDRTFE